MLLYLPEQGPDCSSHPSNRSEDPAVVGGGEKMGGDSGMQGWGGWVEGKAACENYSEHEKVPPAAPVHRGECPWDLGLSPTSSPQPRMGIRLQVPPRAG